jgi:hypothetical protein
MRWVILVTDLASAAIIAFQAKVIPHPRFAFEILECRCSKKGDEIWNLLRPASHTVGESLPCSTIALLSWSS